MFDWYIGLNATKEQSEAVKKQAEFEVGEHNYKFHHGEKTS